MEKRVFGYLMFDRPPLYEFELWDISGNAVADISPLMTNRRYTIELNQAETLTFSVDLAAFEAFCRDKLKVDPNTILAAYQTDVKVRRAGGYLFGAQVIAVGIDGGAEEETISVTCAGYLDLLKDRYITKTYTAYDSAMIARDIIATIQTPTLGNSGITLATGPYLTGVLRDQTYQRDNVKTQLISLAESNFGPFDYAFSWNKSFQTYKRLGSRRDDLSFIWGEGGNIARYALDRLGSRLFNKVHGLGSGFGTDQLVSVREDTVSQLRYYMREKIEQFNSVVQQGTLDQNTASVLAMMKEPLEIPILTMKGHVFADAFPSIGDRVHIDMSAHPFLSSVVGLYRIIKMDITLDDNDFEEVTLYFDDLGVDQDEQSA